MGRWVSPVIVVMLTAQAPKLRLDLCSHSIARCGSGFQFCRFRTIMSHDTSSTNTANALAACVCSCLACASVLASLKSKKRPRF